MVIKWFEKPPKAKAEEESNLAVTLREVQILLFITLATGLISIS